MSRTLCALVATLSLTACAGPISSGRPGAGAGAPSLSAEVERQETPRPEPATTGGGLVTAAVAPPSAPPGVETPVGRPQVELLCDGGPPKVRFHDPAREALFPDHRVVWVLSSYEGTGSCRIYGMVTRRTERATFPDDVRLRAEAELPVDSDGCRCIPGTSWVREGWFGAPDPASTSAR